MISVRDKFKSIIDIDNNWNPVIVRHLSDNRCVCLTQKPMIDGKNSKIINQNFRTVPDPECSICGGAGYIYEEFLYYGLIFLPGFRFAHFEDTPMATTEQNMLTVYIKFGVSELQNTKVNDWLFFVDSDISGKITHPIRRVKKWIINDVQPIRLDRNKLEYVKIYCKPATL